jgi:hypothetical protein
MTQTPHNEKTCCWLALSAIFEEFHQAGMWKESETIAHQHTMSGYWNDCIGQEALDSV